SSLTATCSSAGVTTEPHVPAPSSDVKRVADGTVSPHWHGEGGGAQRQSAPQTSPSGHAGAPGSHCSSPWTTPSPQMGTPQPAGILGRQARRYVSRSRGPRAPSTNAFALKIARPGFSSVPPGTSKETA